MLVYGKNRYAKVDDIFTNFEQDKLLTDNNITWAREAVFKADTVDLDYFVPYKEIDDLIKDLEIQREQFIATGSIAQVEILTDVINKLKNLTLEFN